jgi:penicillin amidase
MNLMTLEQASSVEEALALAPDMGMPHQNLVVGDRDGHIGWTIFGRIPADTGAERARGSGAWTTAREHPRILDPPAGRLWTANARVASDPRQLELIGGHLTSLGSEYDLGARAGQIRDDLMALRGNVKPADMLQIQLDDRATFLARWQSLLLSLLDELSVQGQPQRAELRRLLAGWNGQASVDSVGYRLVRAYHDRVQQAVWDAILAALALQGDEEVGAPAQFEGPLWQLLTTQPVHMLPRPYASWPEFLRAQADGAELPGARPLYLGGTQPCAHPPSAVACLARPRAPARYAAAATAGGPRYAAGAGRCLRRLGTLRGLPRARGGGLPRGARWRERASALTLLPRGLSRLGPR